MKLLVAAQKLIISRGFKSVSRQLYQVTIVLSYKRKWVIVLEFVKLTIVINLMNVFGIFACTKVMSMPFKSMSKFKR